MDRVKNEVLSRIKRDIEGKTRRKTQAATG
jgi:hypothetical protein